MLRSKVIFKWIKFKTIFVKDYWFEFSNEFLGCHVIGFAGTDDKCQTLLKKYGFDKAYNYKKVGEFF